MTAGRLTRDEPATLGAWLDDAMMHFAQRPAIRVDDRSLTYDDLRTAVDRAAAVLAGRGVGVGSRVGLSAGTSVEFITGAFASLKLGAAIVLISTSWREREVQHAVDLAEPTHFVHDGSGAVALAELYPDRPVIDVASLRDVRDVVPAIAPDGVALDEVAVMVFSSGTTGLPKAVRHTHRSMHHATLHWVETLGLARDDRLQILTPPFHILGLLNLFAIVAAGASVRLHRRFDLDTMLQSIERDRVTIEMAVAPIALAMASHPDLESFDLSSLRYIMWGATPVTPSVAETVTRRSGVRFLPAYGASELPVIAVNPVDRPDAWRLDSVGVAPNGVELRVVDIDDGHVLPPGQPGEIQGRSPSLMLGYLPDEANADAFADGWYRTGDIGTLEEGGWVTITDRVKEMIKVNGFQVAPAEVETVLLSHPAVTDCAAYGVPDPDTGEAVVAAVVLAADAAVTTAELAELVETELAGYKRVSAWQVLEAIPRLPSGKVLRRELQSTHTD